MSHNDTATTDTHQFGVDHSYTENDIDNTNNYETTTPYPTKHVQEVRDAFSVPIEKGEVVNCNITTTIGRRVDLHALVEDVEWAEFVEKNQCFCHLSFDGLDASGTLYNTGTVIITGTTNADNIINFYEATHRKLNQLGLNTEWNALEVSNLVVSFDGIDDVSETERSVNLVAVSMSSDNIEYEPERFRGAIYRNTHGGTCLLFNTGSIVVQGARTTEEAVKQREELFGVLNKYDLIDK
jgi:transcription initiation factor TFIID TATA-box-binding protein